MTLLCCGRNVFSFIYLHSNILILCCFIPLGSTDRLVCDTAFGMQHTKFLGGMCYLVKFGWYLGHLESPITPVAHFILMWIFHIFVLSNLKLKFFNLFIHFYYFSLQNSLHRPMVFLLCKHVFTLYWCRNSYLDFLFNACLTISLGVKSSLCVGWPD